MTLAVETRKVTVGDLAQLAVMEHQGAFRLRDGDEKECLAFGMTPHEAITFSIQNSINSYVVTIDGQLVATWGYGIRNPLSGVGLPWLLTTPRIEHHKVFMARESQRIVRQLLTKFIRLDVMVHAEYLRAQTWLEWLGFEGNPAAVMVNNHPFIYMILERKNGPTGK